MSVENIVEGLVEKESFDVFEFISGARLPENDVTLYTDYDAGLRLKRIAMEEKASAKAEAAEGFSLTDDVYQTDEDEVNELVRRIDESSLVFHLRGLAPAARDAIQKHLIATLGKDSDNFWEQYNATIIADSIVSVENALGAQDARSWSPEKVLEFGRGVHPDEFSKLVDTALELNLAANLFDARVSADFS